MQDFSIYLFFLQIYIDKTQSIAYFYVLSEDIVYYVLENIHSAPNVEEWQGELHDDDDDDAIFEKLTVCTEMKVTQDDGSFFFQRNGNYLLNIGNGNTS